MADIKQQMQVYLLDQSGVTDLVDARITPDKLPQKTNPDLPAITLTKISGNSQQHLTGVSGFASVRIQVDCVADTSNAAEALRNQVRLAMQNHASNKGAQSPMGSVTVTGVVYEEQFTRFDPDTAGSDEGRFVSISDVHITHLEETAV